MTELGNTVSGPGILEVKEVSSCKSLLCTYCTLCKGWMPISSIAQVEQENVYKIKV